VTGRRLWLFRIIAVAVIPVLLLLLVEISLRLIGYGYPSTITVKCEVNDKSFYRSNPKFAWRFFSPQIARTTKPFMFAADKSGDTYRIFVLGASAAAGIPDESFCFGRILQTMLRHKYPKTNFDVIVPAMPAINSHVVRQIAFDCARRRGDLFIVYLGNNEVVGPYGAGTVFSPLSSNLSLIRLGIALKATKLGQLISNLAVAARAGDAPQIWRGLGMFLEKQVRADNPNLPIVYHHFKKNLEDIRRIACKHGMDIIFCTVASNLKDSPPFASLHRPGLSEAERKNWDELYQKGIEYETTGDCAAAAEQYLKAAEIDDSFADLQFRLGRCFGELGEFEKSGRRFIQARELDTLRFRADNRINEIIRSVSRDRNSEGVYLVDAVKTFEEHSPHGIAGEELFLEHVHMNFSANYLLASAIFREVQKILPQRVKADEAGDSPALSEEQCARYLVYTQWEQSNIYSRMLSDYFTQPPFTNQLYNDRRIARTQKKLDALRASFSPDTLAEVEEQYRWAIEQTPADYELHWKYGEFLESLGRDNDAARQFRQVLNIVPYHHEAYAKLGFFLGRAGDLDAAVEYNLKAIEIYPIFAQAYFNLGFAYHLKKDYDKAAESYSMAIRLEPDKPISYNNLGLVLSLQEKLGEAVKIYRDGLKYTPNDTDLHRNLGIVLEKQGKREEALKELNTALNLDPNSPTTKQVLDLIQESNTN